VPGEGGSDQRLVLDLRQNDPHTRLMLVEFGLSLQTPLFVVVAVPLRESG
jgi:hypothetical protein